MKKLVNPLPTGGAPLFGTETVVDVLQTEVWDVIEGLMSTLIYEDIDTDITAGNNAIILTGGAITWGAGNNTIDVTAGIIYFPAAKAFARFPQVTALAVTGTTFKTVYIELLDAVIEQKTFADAALKDYFTIRNARIVTAHTLTYWQPYTLTTGVSTKLLPDFNGVYKKPFRKVASNLSNTTVDVFEIGVWNMDVDASKTLVLNTIDKTKIVGVQVIIRSDLLAANVRNQYPIDFFASDAASDQLNGWWYIAEDPVTEGFSIVLNRATNGFFDGANFDGVVDSRGKIIVTYQDTTSWPTT